jgi:hypothetical protein
MKNIYNEEFIEIEKSSFRLLNTNRYFRSNNY